MKSDHSHCLNNIHVFPCLVGWNKNKLIKILYVYNLVTFQRVVIIQYLVSQGVGGGGWGGGYKSE